MAGEGVTDQIVLENILYGLYGDSDEFDVDELAYLQPSLDATDAEGLGGWTRLLKYLENKRFRDDVSNHQFMIVQIDTDVAADKGFDVILVDENNRPLPVESIVENVKQRLIVQMDAVKEGFYDEHKAKIVFAISVHSLECWLFNLHNQDARHEGRIRSCEDHLRRLLTGRNGRSQFTKDKDSYDELSAPFHKRRGRKIDEVAGVDISFRIFIQRLQSLSYPP